MYDLNVRSVFHVTQQCLPLLEASGSDSDPARVINISSIDSISVGALDTFACVRREREGEGDGDGEGEGEGEEGRDEREERRETRGMKLSCMSGKLTFMRRDGRDARGACIVSVCCNGVRVLQRV